jgi:YVTN family beta-propeller protein
MRPPSDTRLLVPVQSITGDLTPKSVVASGRGVVVAQNMIYRHTVSVFDDRSLSLLRTIPDRVRLSAYGFPQYDEPVRGGPVEAAFTPDRRYLYVSNYSMYGPGFARPGDDICSPSNGYDRSFLYRIDTRSWRIDQAIRVGSVPKYVAVTPDGKHVIVSNWCSYDVSIVSTETGEQVRRLSVGAYPRGIAIDPKSRTAYVAIMGSTVLAKIKLADFTVSYIYGVGDSPRHLVMAPKGRYIYITLNDDGTVAKLDRRTETVVARVVTGRAPRSMDIAPDGRALYVVNYESNSVSKVRTSDMAVLQSVPTERHPIGIAYDRRTNDVWVACYSGTIEVYDDKG